MRRMTNERVESVNVHTFDFDDFRRLLSLSFEVTRKLYKKWKFSLCSSLSQIEVENFFVHFHLYIYIAG